MRRGSFINKTQELMYNQLGHETIKNLSGSCLNCGKIKANCNCNMGSQDNKPLAFKSILWYNSEI